MNTTRNLIGLLVLALAASACGGKETDTTTTDRTPDAGAAAPAQLVLDKEPEGALSVLDAKEKAEGDEVVVVGRISKLPRGYMAFTLTDDDLDYCGRGTDCEGKCKTPWDYCCIQAETVTAASMPVEMRDAEGNPVPLADNALLRLLDLVTVRGTLAKTESGGTMLIVRDGVFRKERPLVPDHVVWPD